MSCEICNSSDTELFLQRENVPVHQNLILKTKEKAIKTVRGKLKLNICNNCGFINNKAFDYSKLNYGEDYENNQTESVFFSKYLNEIIDKNFKNLKNKKIIEVGCGNGEFLKRVKKSSPESICYGFDNAYSGNYNDKELKFFRDYFNEEYNYIKPDILICRHVIEHIPKPVGFVSKIIQVSDNPSVEIFFETPCSEWIIENNAFWDFFYEHCSYFNSFNLNLLFKNIGFKNTFINKIFNKQYLWADINKLSSESGLLNHSQPARQISGYSHNNISDKSLKSRENVEGFIKKVKSYSKNESYFINSWRDKLISLKGNIAIWGAGAKGVTFLNLIDPSASVINSVIDINNKKQGCYIPGTGHEIISPDKIKNNEIKNIIIMNPNYFNEIRELVNDNINLLIC